MPIYAYRCSTCGHAQDVLQKISDPLLSVCPACGADSFVKQLTAAGFQLKGSGWYVTDFRDGKNAAAKKDDKSTGNTEAAPADGAAAKSEAATPAAPSPSAPAASPAPSPPSSGPASSP